MKAEIENIQRLVAESDSYSMFARKIGYTYFNGTVARKVKKLIFDNQLDISHFDAGKKRTRKQKVKYSLVEKSCPVCEKKFETKKGSSEEKTTCSYSCSNTYFRSGKNNGSWRDSTYRTTCFLYHEKKCVICAEKNIVEVHHLDENKDNNKPENLVPLCPTHHQYWHSRFKYLVEEKILKYVEEFVPK